MEIKLTKDNFEEEILKNNGLALVDFYTTWCGPCKMMAPIISEIAKEYDDKLKVGKINVDEERELAVNYKVMSIPTLILFKGGKVAKVLVGFHTNEALCNLIDNLLSEG